VSFVVLINEFLTSCNNYCNVEWKRQEDKGDDWESNKFNDAVSVVLRLASSDTEQVCSSSNASDLCFEGAPLEYLSGRSACLRASKNIPEQWLKLDHDCFPIHPFHFII
jgi:hypothetical protein